MRLLNRFIILCAWIAGGCTHSFVNDGYIPVSGNGEIYYERTGCGTPLILLHGHSLDRRMWDSQTAEFSKYFQVIRIDFRGYGRSSSQSETHQFTHLDDLLTVMDSLHIGQAHIVGLSMGAFVAGDMLALHPERMLSCVMASGGIRHTKGPHQPMDSIESARRDREIEEVRAKGIETMKAEWIETLIAGGGSRREEIRKPLTEMVGDWDGWQPLHKEVRMFWAEEAWQELQVRRPEVPTLILKGETELKGKPLKPRELEFLPCGRAEVVPDCGHLMNMEQPELFNKIVLDFLTSLNK